MKISVIIPAYNEESTIADVIKTVKKVPVINNIIVVSDGSTDNTVSIAKNLDVEVCQLKENIGKGGAIKKGFEKTDSDILLFLDADLIGLTIDHIHELINPIIEDKADMSLGIFTQGRLLTDLPQFLMPYLTGQRAIKRYIIDVIPDLDLLKYGLEVAITKVVKRYNFRVSKVKLPNLTQRMKEEKYGIVEGAKKRLQMYLDIVKQLKSD
ncbi:MAG: glycosyltransferase family 2 protein [Candidatus Caldatribacteriota bacterium]|jgi:glycosyltransferase involved in cell wall biosynthesis|nr:glycosyltransferase family 2 protein [Atribacterota bacterium]MDD3640220.1 glycosyltransferase family 2 protein [Atribacterota bacterium]MDD4288506.1 glycosyltransferase family 2 protein [Atribacterota bacterium]MDD4764256.1 glycosyltransferase family 2 protein [Atribacterota bacterium]MDD5635247.1 glycosyltransferase family 2 protein [Atribacterota bacterium]